MAGIGPAGGRGERLAGVGEGGVRERMGFARRQGRAAAGAGTSVSAIRPVPGIDDRHATVLEMRDIAGGDRRGTPRHRDGGDLQVGGAERARPARLRRPQNPHKPGRRHGRKAAPGRRGRR